MLQARGHKEPNAYSFALGEARESQSLSTQSNVSVARGTTPTAMQGSKLKGELNSSSRLTADLLTHTLLFENELKTVSWPLFLKPSRSISSIGLHWLFCLFSSSEMRRVISHHLQSMFQGILEALGKDLGEPSSSDTNRGKCCMVHRSSSAI